MRAYLKLSFLCAILIFGSFNLVIQSYAWSNGGYSAEPSNLNYGTHDWIAQHAANWLPIVERKWIADNLNLFLYGTEYPDNNATCYKTIYGYGDSANHHNYYNASGFVTDASAAYRAQDEYGKAFVELRAGRNDTASIYAGSMTHYIADGAVFGHVMTGEIHHDDYENYVETCTTSYNYGVFESYLVFDGNLENISAYDASISLGCNTFNDNGGNYTADWMDANYDWSNPDFKNRCGESLNLATNYVADVFHTLYMMYRSKPFLSQVVINEFEQNPQGEDSGYEWVELYNPTASTVNVSSWTLSTTRHVTVNVTIPSNITIKANDYYICPYSQQWLDNDNESIILKNASGVEIDRTPTKNDSKNDNFCWARFLDGYDTNSSLDWTFQLATKGASNSKASSSISCSLSSTSLDIGSSIKVSGVITPAIAGATVTLSYNQPNSTVLTRTIASTTDGKYNYTYVPSVPGSWNVKASWEGNSTYYRAVSEPVSFSVSKLITSITLSLSSSTIYIGFKVEICGKIICNEKGIPNAPIFLSYSDAGGNSWSNLTLVDTNSNGEFSAVWMPSVTGNYLIEATWAGDSTYSSSNIIVNLVVIV